MDNLSICLLPLISPVISALSNIGIKTFGDLRMFQAFYPNVEFQLKKLSHSGIRRDQYASFIQTTIFFKTEFQKFSISSNPQINIRFLTLDPTLTKENKLFSNCALTCFYGQGSSAKTIFRQYNQHKYHYKPFLESSVWQTHSCYWLFFGDKFWCF